MTNVWFKDYELMVNLNQNLAWLFRQEVIYSSPVLDLDHLMAFVLPAIVIICIPPVVSAELLTTWCWEPGLIHLYIAHLYL